MRLFSDFAREHFDQVGPDLLLIGALLDWEGLLDLVDEVEVLVFRDIVRDLVGEQDIVLFFRFAQVVEYLHDAFVVIQEVVALRQVDIVHGLELFLPVEVDNEPEQLVPELEVRQDVHADVVDVVQEIVIAVALVAFRVSLQQLFDFIQSPGFYGDPDYLLEIILAEALVEQVIDHVLVFLVDWDAVLLLRRIIVLLPCHGVLVHARGDQGLHVQRIFSQVKVRIRLERQIQSLLILLQVEVHLTSQVGGLVPLLEPLVFVKLLAVAQSQNK